MTNPKFKIDDTTTLSKVRDTYTELVDYLKEITFQKRILERPSYMELSIKLGYTYNWIKDKKDTLKSHTPKKETFDDLYTRLSEKHKELLKNAWKTIEIKFQNLYNLSFPTDSNLPSSPTLTEKSIKRKFFDDIKDIIIKFFPKARIFDTDISRLFFKRARALKDTHLKRDYKFRRLDLSTLFNFIYKIRFLTKEEFVKKVRDIRSVDQETLEMIKTDIENYIQRFIFSNPYDDSKYISDKHDKGTEYNKPEYNLTFYMWFEISKIKKGPQLLKHIRKLVNYYSFGRLTRGYMYSWDGIMNMLSNLKSLIPSRIYSKIFEKSWQYLEIRGLTPIVPEIYHPSWYTESTIKFHIVILLIRDLGLDILNLKPIKPESFEKIHGMRTDTFERHHIFPNDKYSIDVNRLALVMHMYHYELEGKTELILDLIKSRIDLSFESPQYYKDNIIDWNLKWQEYLERRNFLIEYGIANFINKYFTDKNRNNYIIERFFKNIPESHIEREITYMMHEWIKKKRPAPILNIYILNRLFMGTPYLLNSGFIGFKKYYPPII